MGRGRKICPVCQTPTGPRAFQCKNCGHQYNIQKGASKAKRGRRGKEVDWKDIQVGDHIKVMSGSGPYWELESGERENLGYRGFFKVVLRDHNGLGCQPVDKRNSGFCFIYMGKPKKHKNGVMRRPHKIRKVEEKYVSRFYEAIA